MMHLFLIRDGEPEAFAHLHPTPQSRKVFQAPLPPLPAGRYHLYADVTHENGFAETLIAMAEIPPASAEMKKLWLGKSAEPICSLAVAQMLATNLFVPPDPDDSWQMDIGGANSSQLTNTSSGATERVVQLSGGFKLIWENPGTLVENRDAPLTFKLVTPDDQPALVEPYMGMAGHAVLRRQDGAVFAHVHPVGTFSMASQELFTRGPAPKRGALSAEESLRAPPLHAGHTNAVGVAGEISFPYAFPKPGPYRLWVQAKSQDKIFTGVFDATVGAAQ
jgi:hypothetical protein